MKARHMLMTMTLAMIPATLSMAQNDDVYGTRIDYLNEKGERVVSTYPYTNGVMFEGRQYDNGWYVSYNGVYGFNSMKMTPYGTESYNLDVKSEMPLEYYIKTDDDLPERIKAETTQDFSVLCGKTVVFRVEVPKNEYPSIRILQTYTSVRDGEEYWYGYSEAPFSSYLAIRFNGDPTVMTNPTQLDYILDCVDGDGFFKLVEEKNGNNVWECEFVMANQPCRLEFFTAKAPDGKRLRDLTDWTLYKVLYTQYNGLDWNGNTGENWILQKIGDGLSQDLVSSFYNLLSNKGEYFGLDVLKNARAYISVIPWADYYAMIMRANILIDNLDLCERATDSEKDIARAQMLALRAHAYTRILQLYGKRWSDSDNGAAYCAPLIISSTDYQKPLATMADIYKQAITDLQTAEDIFRNNNYTRTDILQPDINVVHALQMRLYMLGEEWTYALEAAKKILDVYPLSTNDDIQSGFFQKRDSWIWGASSDYEVAGNILNIYYWAPQNYNACNGAYPAVWSMGCNAIDRNLFLQIPENDVRHSFFMMPEVVKITPWKKIETWYDNKYVSSFNGVLSVDGDNIAVSKNFANMYTKKKIPGVVYGPFRYGKNDYVPVQFGSQIKFQGSGEVYGIGFTSGDPGSLFIRSDEALLTAAEAYVMSGDNMNALALLNKLNNMRNPDYTTILTGEDLLNEIKLYRRIELWGEGHSWFDFKRWNMPMHRNLWVNGVTTSGNWFEGSTQDVAVDAANGWRFSIPRYYVKQNPNIDITKMGYEDVYGYEENSNAPKAVAPVKGKRGVNFGVPVPSTEPRSAISTEMYMK